MVIDRPAELLLITVKFQEVTNGATLSFMSLSFLCGAKIMILVLNQSDFARLEDKNANYFNVAL